MTEDRERQLLGHVPTLKSGEELTGFRDQLRKQGEEPTSALFKALITQQERINRK